MMDIEKQEKHYQQFLKNNLTPRRLVSLDDKQGCFLHVKKENKTCINFASSDYLGLSQHPFLIERVKEYTAKYGVGSGASRLVTGNLTIYDELEANLAKALNKPAALILGSGYQANFSVIEALLDKTVLNADPLIFCDRLVHNSIITGLKQGFRIIRFSHNDYDQLENYLKQYELSLSPKFIFAESIYSMEGDQADLNKLSQLAKQYQAFLYVDDAHAVGVYGEDGFGLAKKQSEAISIIMGTFSKALGSFGGYIGCSMVLKEYLVNKCKGLIYSTALPPPVLGAISAAVEIIPTLSRERKKIMQYGEELRTYFDLNGLKYNKSTTHIIPWIIGDANLTYAVSQKLLEEGILATAIRPPSVPANQSRIRFCLSSEHSEEDLQHLKYAIRKVADKLQLRHDRQQK